MHCCYEFVYIIMNAKVSVVIVLSVNWTWETKPRFEMEDRRRCTTVRQLEVLFDYLEGHPDLALGRVRSKEARAVAARLWQECAETLNSLGPARTGKEWAKVWNDQKCRIKAKLVAINKSHQATGGGPSNAPILTALEEKVANIIGRDVGPLPNVGQDQFLVDCIEVVAEATESRDNLQDAENPITLNIVSEEIPQICSPTPSLSGQIPSPSSEILDTQRETIGGVIRARARRRAARAPHSHSSSAQVRASQVQSSRSAVDESRSMVLTIEELRAQAALQNAQALNNFSESFRSIAESIGRMCRQYCSSDRSPRRTPPPPSPPL